MQLPFSWAGNSQSMPLLLLLPLLFLVGLGGLASAVPASVLAQNTELSTNANANSKQAQTQQQAAPVAATAEKRSIAEDATVAPADKKSSPEIVPASFSNAPPPAKSISNSNNHQMNGVYPLPSNEEILAAVAAAAAQSSQLQDDTPANDDMGSSTLRKRGINYDYNPYAGNDYVGYGGGVGAASAGGYGSDVPQGVWADEYEPAINYNDRELQDMDDYVPERRVNSANARNKAYDNLQNLLNAEAYLESIPLSVPLQYANRNYGSYGLDTDARNKRGIYYNMGGAGENLNKFRRYGDLRLKRDTTKLTPADMLALVALVEAGERARKESDVENAAALSDSYNLPKQSTAYETDDLDYVGNGVGVPNSAWLDSPALVDYYGAPLNVETVPKYEYLPRQHKYMSSNNRFGSSKRFMVAKKKRSVSQFINEPSSERGEKYY